MSSAIKVELFRCSKEPRSMPYVCSTSIRLTAILEKVRALDNKEFTKVYDFAQKTELPEDFLEALKTEYKNRRLNPL